MDLHVIDFVPYCEVFLIMTSSSVFWFLECYSYVDRSLSKSNSQRLWASHPSINQIQIGNCLKLLGL